MGERMKDKHLQITSVCAYCPYADTDQAYYDLIVKKASALLSSVQVNMLKFALSLRAYSATVHSFQQVQEYDLILCLRCVYFCVLRTLLFCFVFPRLDPTSLPLLDAQLFSVSMEKNHAM